MLVRVLDHHHGGIDHGADGDCDPAERHDVGINALVAHDDEGHQDAQGQGDDRDQRRAQVPEEDQANQGNHRELFQQLVAEVIDGAVDQLRTVIGGDHLDAGRQAALQAVQLGLHRGDGIAGILSGAQDDHATYNFTLAIQLGNATTHLWPQLNGGHLTQQHRNSAGRSPQRHIAEIRQAL